MGKTKIVKGAHYFFVLFGFCTGNWLVLIPQLKDKFSLSESQLGWLLFVVSAAAISNYLFVSKVIRIVSLRSLEFVLQIAVPLCFLLFWLSPWLWLTVIFSATLGTLFAYSEVAINLHASRLEVEIKRKILSSCHAYWSIGALLGAITAGSLSEILSGEQIMLLITPCVAFIGIYVWSRALFPQHIPIQTSTKISLPTFHVLMITIIPLGVMTLEGVFMDWSALFLRDIFHTSPLFYSMGFWCFSIAMILGRLSGDRLADIFATHQIVRICSLFAASGAILFAWSTNLPLALCGAFLCGLGASVIYPMAVRAVSLIDPNKSQQNVAFLSMVVSIEFLLLPPLVGQGIEAIGFRETIFITSFLCVISLALATKMVHPQPLPVS